jgi:N-acyl homoserine lactone hydrolase
MTPSDGTPQRLYLMQLEHTTIPIVGSAYGMVVCYLIQTSDCKNILVDSGIPAEYEPPQGAPRHTHEHTVITRLAELGLRPENVDILVCTHFDTDHAGFHDAFPQAELVVQRAHYELAQSGNLRFAATRSHWDAPALRYRLIDGDTELLPGLTLIETSGHTTGHQSVLVRLPQTGPVLLTIDAVALERLFTPERTAWPLDENEGLLLASTRKLLDLVEREQVALVVFGHDGDQWQTLKQAPDCYE